MIVSEEKTFHVPDRQYRRSAWYGSPCVIAPTATGSRCSADGGPENLTDSSGSVPPLENSREQPLTRTPRQVLIFAATSSAEGQIPEVKQALVARTSQ